MAEKKKDGKKKKEPKAPAPKKMRSLSKQTERKKARQERHQRQALRKQRKLAKRVLAFDALIQRKGGKRAYGRLIDEFRGALEGLSKPISLGTLHKRQRRSARKQGIIGPPVMQPCLNYEERQQVRQNNQNPRTNGILETTDKLSSVAPEDLKT